MRFLFKHFLRGILIVVPAAATLWILYAVFVFVDGLIQLPTHEWTLPFTDKKVPGIPTHFPGLGVLITITLITLVGLLTSNYVARGLLGWSERIFTKMPVVKLVYNSIKDLIGALVSERKKFDKPVLLSISDEVQVIGFITREDLEEFGLEDSVGVYVPQSYNFAANLLLVPSERVTPLDKPATEVMAFVVSGGVAT